MLSKENEEKLILGEPRAYYKAEPFGYYAQPENARSAYWCRNWTFRPFKKSDGRIFMIDTFYDDIDRSFEVTDENIDNFEFIFRKGEYARDNRGESWMYDPKDIKRARIGDYEGSSTWIRKGAKPLPDKLLHHYRYEVESAYNSLNSRLSDLNEQEEKLGLPITTMEAYILLKELGDNK